MNCIDLFRTSAQSLPSHPAIWMEPNKVTTFGQLQNAAAAAQLLCLQNKVKQGDGVLLFGSISPNLYATIIGIMGLGAHAILVEPWMPLPLINRAVDLMKPKLFLTSFFGRAWGMRSTAIRAIPKWSGFNLENISRISELIVEAVPNETVGMVTFTSGTTGSPKGAVRTHGQLVEQHFALSDALRSKNFKGSDLTVFANMVLTNLASGRCSIIVPHKRTHKFYQTLKELPQALAPETLTCGPAFLQEFLATAPLPSLRSIHIGGALTDCDLFDKGFTLLPESQWLHVYGSSEAEPVACCDARIAVLESRERGYFQTLYLGRQIPEIQARFESNSLWVTGQHVSQFYLGDEAANERCKKQDEAGLIWHDMGDRVKALDKGWWYMGRSNQPEDEFMLEQKIYHFLQSSHSFIHRDQNGHYYLFGENVHQRREEILKAIPVLTDVFEAVVYRDRRHRARIDRKLSLQKGASWIVG